jgi:hypothetical protein
MRPARTVASGGVSVGGEGSVSNSANMILRARVISACFRG